MGFSEAAKDLHSKEPATEVASSRFFVNFSQPLVRSTDFSHYLMRGQFRAL
jgi:hypothetical protein